MTHDILTAMPLYAIINVKEAVLMKTAKKHVRKIYICIIVLVCLLVLNCFASTLTMTKKRLNAIIKFNYPSYDIISLVPEYTDWFPSVRPADEDHRATSATAVVRNDKEQRTIHFEKVFGIWIRENDKPDYGHNVPDDEYFLEAGSADIGKKSDIDEEIKGLWIIPYEDGTLYKKSYGEDWYYYYRYVKNMYRTGNGNVYVLNKDTFEWEPTDIGYSELDYFGNYERITKDKAEDMIDSYRS